MDKENSKIKETIRRDYSAIARANNESSCCSGASCCCTSGSSSSSGSCCGSGILPDQGGLSELLGYSPEDIASVPDGANMGLGCGNPLAISEMEEGEVVLDLGSGGGFDAFLASRKVGESGRVIGVDMTEEMVEKARRNAESGGYSNVDFRLGDIEALPVDDESVDVIISNCVINMSLNKHQVFNEAFRVLKPRGRLAISDVVATTELPAEVKSDLDKLSACYVGAETASTLEKMLETAGFTDIRLAPLDQGKEIISSWQIGANVEDYIASYSIEATKPI
ncbi:MAG: arsenite methyltransferase [Eubacteriales bacterium]|nr:arsenite methyltransferase [Eubacteriales bacterium]